MKWVAEGMVVYRPDRAGSLRVHQTTGEVERVEFFEPQQRGVVLVAAGNDARVRFDDGTESWERVDNLLSEAQVAQDAARMLGAD
jgi:hypothetical protein